VDEGLRIWEIAQGLQSDTVIDQLGRGAFPHKPIDLVAGRHVRGSQHFLVEFESSHGTALLQSRLAASTQARHSNSQKIELPLLSIPEKGFVQTSCFLQRHSTTPCIRELLLREAVILSSVLVKATVPAMHVAATLVRLCVMSPWYGTTSVLIAALVNKKYNLPLQVIESLVAHFCAFLAEDGRCRWSGTELSLSLSKGTNLSSTRIRSTG